MAVHVLQGSRERTGVLDVMEVLVDGDRFAVVADRIAPDAIMAAERVPEWLER